MATIISTLNSTNSTLPAGGVFMGKYDFVGGYNFISVAYNANTIIDPTNTLEIRIRQSYNGIDDTQINGYIVPMFITDAIILPLSLRYVRVEVINNSSVLPLDALMISTKYSAVYPDEVNSNITVNINPAILPLPVNANITNASLTVQEPQLDSCISNGAVNVFDSVLNSVVSNYNVNVNLNDINTTLTVPGQGLKVYVANSSPLQVENTFVGQTSTMNTNITNANLDINILNSNLGVSVLNSNLDVNILNSNLGVSVLNSNITTLDNGFYKPLNTGDKTAYEFIPNSVNNTSYYYADGAQGINVPSGWQFTSTAISPTVNTKINWYLYQPGSVNIPITELDAFTAKNSYYVVIDNNPSGGGGLGVEYPFFIIYTKPSYPLNKNTGGSAGSSWYQSKFFYQASVAGTTGQRLLYVGNDPVNVLPSIPHIKCSLLSALCAGTLQSDETILSVSLQTSSASGGGVSPPGNFSFTMEKFGGIVPEIQTQLKTDMTGTLITSNPVIENCIYQNKVATTNAILDATVSSNKVNTNITNASLATTNAILDGTVSAGKVKVDIAGQTTTPLTVKEKATTGFNLNNVGSSATIISNLPCTIAGVYIGNKNATDTNYFKLYDSITATFADTPSAIFPLDKQTTQFYIDCKNLNFSVGASVRCSGAYDDTSSAIAPHGTPFITAFGST